MNGNNAGYIDIRLQFCNNVYSIKLTNRLHNGVLSIGRGVKQYI